MISINKGNLLEADVEALVNTVNTVGIMGKGIALQFKKAFPDNFTAYKKACEAKEVQPGKIFLFRKQGLYHPRYILNFPTKRHWKGDSKLQDIESGLKDLVKQVVHFGIKSIAIPPLGCGHGGLNWAQVYPLIEKAFADLPDIKVFVYPPSGAPAAENMINKTKCPEMTLGRAAMIGLMSRYCELGYRLALLEIHKLAYFLQEAGERLNLKFEKQIYGPYADQLRHVLNTMEGHFIQGFGDGNNKPTTPIVLLPEAAEKAEKFLENNEATLIRFQRVAGLIEGFETPYGMELLATVHWVIKEEKDKDIDSVIASVSSWNKRKQERMKPEHIKVAWQRLHNKGWI